ncbi:MAG TPA: hypothetical protein VII01_02900 [Solirubrobacteraceae bacterium]|jgi:hypothetical protein
MPGRAHSAPSISPAPSTEEEAAAIVAALARFMRATAAPAAAADQALDPWARAAILEGVARAPGTEIPDPWINT